MDLSDLEKIKVAQCVLIVVGDACRRQCLENDNIGFTHARVYEYCQILGNLVSDVDRSKI
jgi:hypothetical protein